MNPGLAAFNKAKYARFGYPLGGLGATFGPANDARALCASRGGSWSDSQGCVAPSSVGATNGQIPACLNAGGTWGNGRCEFSDTVTVTGTVPPQIVKTEQPQADEGPGIFSQALDALQFWKPSAPKAQFNWNTPNSTPYVAIGLVAVVLVGGYLLWRNS